MTVSQAPKQRQELLSLAKRKGFDVTRTIVKHLWRLTGPNGAIVRHRETGSAAFTFKQAMRYLEAQPDRK